MTVRIFHQSEYDPDPIKGILFGFFEGISDWRDKKKLIVIKPNWVQEAHEYDADIWEPVITHPSLVIAVIECLAENLRSGATICICDAPHTYADFEAIINRGGLKQRLSVIQSQWPDISIQVLDLRREVWMRKEEVVVERNTNPFDPMGYACLNLSSHSMLYGYHGEGRYYGADYDAEQVNRHHTSHTQEYLLAGTPLCCDLFINLPKLKTHKKTGITCSLKNLVGINGDKNWLPHHTEGSPANGGDEFPDDRTVHAIERRLKGVGRRMALSMPGIGGLLYRKMRNAGKIMLGDSETVIRNGNWHGNDTCWRMVLDLNRALLYGNMDGTWREAGQAKNYLTIVDGIVGGEGNGPLCPAPVKSNVLIIGADPAGVDAVAARLMGYDPLNIPLIREAFADHRWPLSFCGMDDLKVFDARTGETVGLNYVKPTLNRAFKPHFGWAELTD